ncbi:MAG: glutamate--cysteine ligase [Nocardioides sp.]|nr:glutamate--cysteine ligase [Nocardioides sp.]MDP3889640.1 glutamate--cysteine ligase [Nocardioides sp.]
MRTVGVEEELLLVDAHSGHPLSVSAQVLRAAEARGGADPHPDQPGGSLQQEFQQEQVETDTAPVADMLELQAELRSWRDRAGAAASDANARLVATGTSPLPVEPTMVHHPRFEKMAERFGLTANEQLTCGCHVHVAVESDHEAVGVLDRIREWLPAILALSANSPLWQGRDTRYASFRSQAMARWPSAGPNDVFGSTDAYRQRIEAMVASGVILDEAMIYADARAAQRYPTVEIRVADVCLDVRDTVLIAALCRALVETAARQWADGQSPIGTPTALLRLAMWQAGKDGIGGQLLDPQRLVPRPAREVVAMLLDHTRSALRSNGDEALVRDRIEQVLAVGRGARRQRSVLERTGQLSEVVLDLALVTAGHQRR